MQAAGTLDLSMMSCDTAQAQPVTTTSDSRATSSLTVSAKVAYAMTYTILGSDNVFLSMPNDAATLNLRNQQVYGSRGNAAGLPLNQRPVSTVAPISWRLGASEAAVGKFLPFVITNNNGTVGLGRPATATDVFLKRSSS